MPYAIHVDPASRTALICLSGLVNGPEVIAACWEAFSHPDWEPDFSTLWDAQEIGGLLLLPEHVAAYEAEAEGFMKLRGHGRDAVVAGDLDVKTSALLLALKGKETSRRSFRVFDDVAEAEAWLAKGGAATE